MAVVKCPLLLLILGCSLVLALPAKKSKDLDEQVLKSIAEEKKKEVKDGETEQKTVENQAEDEASDTQEMAPHLQVVPDWPSQDLELGQVAGVATDAKGNVVVLHRGERVWGFRSFNKSNHYQEKDEGPIKMAAILILNPETGAILKSTGKNKFFLPHGLTVDQEGNTFVTDVAMHQVFKFAPDQEEPVLTLGKAFVPVSDVDDTTGFCQPTDVAVASNGHFFVSDGYCNSRVLKYNEKGELLGVFGQEEFLVPHSLALIEDLDVICVADREHRRIACYNAGLQNARHLGRPEREYSMSYLGRVYALEYDPTYGLMYALNGPEGRLPGEGITIDLAAPDAESSVIDAWSPNEQGFDAPHDVTVSKNGQVYVGEVGPNNLWKFVAA